MENHDFPVRHPRWRAAAKVVTFILAVLALSDIPGQVSAWRQFLSGGVPQWVLAAIGAGAGIYAWWPSLRKIWQRHPPAMSLEKGAPVAALESKNSGPELELAQLRAAMASSAEELKEARLDTKVAEGKARVAEFSNKHRQEMLISHIQQVQVLKTENAVLESQKAALGSEIKRLREINVGDPAQVAAAGLDAVRTANREADDLRNGNVLLQEQLEQQLIEKEKVQSAADADAMRLRAEIDVCRKCCEWIARKSDSIERFGQEYPSFLDDAPLVDLAVARRELARYSGRVSEIDKTAASLLDEVHAAIRSMKGLPRRASYLLWGWTEERVVLPFHASVPSIVNEKQRDEIDPRAALYLFAHRYSRMRRAIEEGIGILIENDITWRQSFREIVGYAKWQSADSRLLESLSELGKLPEFASVRNDIDVFWRGDFWTGDDAPTPITWAVK